MPIEDIILQMKTMGISNIINFSFPTPPEATMLRKGLKLLFYLGALDSKQSITELGKTMGLFPLTPRFAKMLVIGNQHKCMPYIIAIVAALTVGDPVSDRVGVGVG
jgi:ATP-dependent RNA helicase DHX37/DHR1